MKKQRRGLNRYVLQNGQKPEIQRPSNNTTENLKQKKNMLSPGGPSHRRKLRPQPTKMNSFMSVPS